MKNTIHQCCLLFLFCFLLIGNACTQEDHPSPMEDNNVVIPKEIFAKDKSYVYSATLYDDNEQLLSEEQINFLATGEPWQFQPDLQKELIIEYDYTDAVKEIFTPFPFNTSLSPYWSNSVVEGIIEDENRLWMHPIRSNQYAFTEVAPFPKVLFPLSIGKAWESSLEIGYGWGDWNGTKGDQSYEVVEQINATYPIGDLDNVWVISSAAVFPFGTSTLLLHYHEKYGFVKKDYRFYTGHRIAFVLETAKYQGVDF